MSSVGWYDDIVEANDEISNLQARLSEAEEQADRDGTERYVMNEQLWAKQKRLERAEEVVEAVKNCAHLSAYCTCREAIRRYEEQA